MLNPKISEMYEEATVNVFYSLVEFIGKDLAETCFVIANDIIFIDDVPLPATIYTTDRERWEELASLVDDFVSEFIQPYDTKGIVTYSRNVSEEDDIQLWLNVER